MARVPYGEDRDVEGSPPNRSASIKHKEKKDEGPVHALGAKKPGFAIPCSGTPHVEYFTSMVRVRPYSPAEAEESKKAGIDPTLSSLELDYKKDSISLYDAAGIQLKKPGTAAPKKQWTPSGFSKMLWSFGSHPKKWDDDIEHQFCPQSSVYDEVTRQDDLVKRLYDGLSQAVIVFGAPGTGKTFTAIGDTNDPGIAPKALTSIFNSRKTRVRSKPGEKIRVEIEVSLLRVWKEQIEDLTQSLAQNGTTSQIKQLKLAGEGTLEGMEPLILETDADLRDLLTRVHRLAKRRERRSSCIVHVNLSQVSTFAGDSNRGEEVQIEAAKVSAFTICDIGAGNKLDSESQNDGKLITKARTSLTRMIDLLQQKSDVEAQAEKVNTEYGHSNIRVQAPKVPYKESKLTHVLAEQLGGNCQTTVVCCVSPYHRHGVDNSLTLEVGRHAKKIRSKCQKREGKELNHLRGLNEERLQVKKQIHSVNVNVERVSQELTDRQQAVNLLKAEGRTLADVYERQLADKANYEQYRRETACAVTTMRTMMNGQTMVDMQDRINTAMDEQSTVRRKMAQLKLEVMVMECETGEKNISELEAEVEMARNQKDRELHTLQGAIQSDAISLLQIDIPKGTSDGTDPDCAATTAALHIGDAVEIRHEGEWASATIKDITSPSKKDNSPDVEEEEEAEVEVTPIFYEVTGISNTGVFTERLTETQTRNQVRRKKVVQTEEAETEPNQLSLLSSMALVNSEMPELKAFIEGEIKIAQRRLSTHLPDTSSGKPAPLNGPIFAKTKPELASYIKEQVIATLPEAEGTKIPESIMSACEKAINRLASEMDTLDQRESKLISKMVELSEQKVWPPAYALNELNEENPACQPKVIAVCLEVMKITRDRLDLVLEYVRTRESFNNVIEEWKEVMEECIVEPARGTAEAEIQSKQVELIEEQLKLYEELNEELESHVKAEAQEKAAKEAAAAAAKKKAAAKKPDGCCSMM